MGVGQAEYCVCRAPEAYGGENTLRNESEETAKIRKRGEERGGELFASVYANLAFPPGRETDAVARAAKFGWFKRGGKKNKTAF